MPKPASHRHRSIKVLLTLALSCLAMLLLSSAPIQTAGRVQPAPTPVEPGQTAPLPIDQLLRFDHLTLEDGLSQNTVLALIQDRQGFIWAATQDGLNRYDGYNFTVYKHDPQNTNSLSQSSILSLYQDRQGFLWVGTWGGGLDRFDPNTNSSGGGFTHYQHNAGEPSSLSSDIVTSILEDDQNRLWVGTCGGGLNLLDRQTGRFTQYRHDPSKPNSLNSDNISTLYQVASGELWVGTGCMSNNGAGLNRMDQQNGIPTGSFTHFRSTPADSHSLSGDNVSAIVQDSKGYLWVGTGGYTLNGSGLNRIDLQTGEITRFQNNPADLTSLSSNNIMALMIDSSGLLWIGTWGGGLDFMDLESGARPATGGTPASQEDNVKPRFFHQANSSSRPQSVSSDVIWSFLEDRSGVFWVGTANGGLNKLNPQVQRFGLYRHDPAYLTSLSTNAVGPILEDSQNRIWVATLGGGLELFDRQRGVFTHYTHPDSDPLATQENTYLALYEDHSGTLWVGTLAGLGRFDPTSRTTIFYRHDPGDIQSLASDNVTSILQDQEEHLWVGTLTGLDWFDQAGGRFVHVQIPGLESVFRLYLDRDGILWAGSWGQGLFRIDPQTLSGSRVEYTRYSYDPADPASLSDNNIFEILQDHTGTLWFGTQVGLDRFDPTQGTFRHYAENDGLVNNTILCMLEDDQGTLWISTNGGLSNFDPAAENFRNFDVQDGLQSDEFNSGACGMSREGEMYFGGQNGLNIFRPDAIQDNPLPPPVAITAFRIFNEPVQADLSGQTPIQLSYSDNFIAFEFVALDFHAPQKNQYAYKLDGFNEDWVAAGTRRYVSYTNLRGGDYLFHVKAANNDGVWNETGFTLNIHVTPPFWETWWFRLGGLLALAGTLVLGVRWRIGSVQSQNRRLETMVLERTAELSQANQQLELEIEQRKRAESALAQHAAKELQQSEARFQAMFENAAIGIAIFDQDRRPLAVNNAIVEMSGYSQDEMLQMTGLDLTYAPDREVGMEEFREMLAGKRESFQVEKRYVCKDGSLYWVRITTSIVRSLEGEPQYLISMVEDIDEQKCAQEELSLSEARFRAVFDYAEMGIVITNFDPEFQAQELDNALFSQLIASQKMNPVLLRMFGYSQEELQHSNLNASELIYEEDRGLDAELFRELFEGKRDAYRIEKRYVRKDGNIFWGRLNYSLVRAEDGSPRMAIGILEDIDEEKRAQEDLRQSEVRFRAIFDNVAVGMALMTLDRQVLQINQTAERIIGYSAGETRHLNPSELAIPDDRNLDMELFAELAAGQRDNFQVEKRYQHKDGHIFWGRVTYSSVNERDGKPQYLIALIEDIDEEKRAQENLANQDIIYRRILEQRVAERTLELRQTNEQLQQAIEDRQKVEVALAQKAAEDAVVAERNRLARDLHDAVTQTLFSASLIAEVIPQLWDMNPDEARKRLNELRELTRGALAEMRTLLLELRPSALTDSALPDLLRQLTEAIIGRARLPIHLTVEGYCALPPEVQVALYRIAQEALNNTVKYARANQVGVNLRLREDMVRFSVIDDGVGFDLAAIPPNHLGLHIMRERAEAIGAKLNIYSEPGEGTQVTVLWHKPEDHPLLAAQPK